MIFRKGGPQPTAREMQMMIRQLHSRIMGGKNINVRTSGDRIIIDKIKGIKKRDIYPKEDVETHGGFIVAHDTRAYHYTANAWKTYLYYDNTQPKVTHDDYGLRNYRCGTKVKYTVITHDSVESDWYPPEDDPDNYSEAPPIFDFDTDNNTPYTLDDLGYNGAIVCYKYFQYGVWLDPPSGPGKCYYRFQTDPNDPYRHDDIYWAFDGEAVFTEYQNAITAAINNIPTDGGSIESDVSWYVAFGGDYYDFGIQLIRWIKFVLDWTWGGDGLTEDLTWSTNYMGLAHKRCYDNII